MTQVLFVCVKNGGKSQMAAGLLQHLLAELHTSDIQVGSAGTTAGSKLNRLSVQILAENDVDISDARPRQLTPELQRQSDWVIALGVEAHVEPIPGPRYETWETDEPSLRGIDGEERMRVVRDDIAAVSPTSTPASPTRPTPTGNRHDVDPSHRRMSAPIRPKDCTGSDPAGGTSCH